MPLAVLGFFRHVVKSRDPGVWRGVLCDCRSNMAGYRYEVKLDGCRADRKLLSEVGVWGFQMQSPELLRGVL
jgi:hypothetical protein